MKRIKKVWYWCRSISGDAWYEIGVGTATLSLVAGVVVLVLMHEK